MALSLSRDRRVLLLDADVSSRSLDVFCGASPTFHLGDVLLGRCDMARAVCVPFPEVYPNLSFCPAPFYKEEAELPDGFAHAIPQVIDTAAGAYDAVVIDTGSGFAIPRAVASHCDTAFVCSEQSPASIRAHIRRKCWRQSPWCGCSSAILICGVRVAGRERVCLK